MNKYGLFRIAPRSRKECSDHSLTQSDHVEEGTWLSEMAIWLPWVHCGQVLCDSPCGCFVIPRSYGSEWPLHGTCNHGPKML